ncbi:MAG: C1 family peptidase [Acidobacteriota bacterium]
MGHHSSKKQKNQQRKAGASTVLAPIKRLFVGYKPMKASPKARGYAAAAATPGADALPPKVDLRPLMPPVLDQGETSSCVANATAGSYDYWIKRATKKDYDVSRLFVYYNARWSNGDQDKDDGSVIQLAMEGLQKFGACSEASWPFDKRILTKKPNGTAYAEASKAKIKEMAHVETTLNDWRRALADGYPIVFGCILFDSFDQCSKRGGVVPMPNPAELTRAEHGGHSMCCVGYSDAEKVFIVRNSWGSEWGDKGYCYMSYDYLMNSKFNDGDSWVFVPDTPLAAPQEAWNHDDTPVTNGGEGVDFDINPYAADAYDGIDFAPLITWAIEWLEGRPHELSKYVELVDDEKFDQLEHFDVNAVLAASETVGQTQGASGVDHEDPADDDEASDDAEADSDQDEDEEEDADDTEEEEDAEDEVDDESDDEEDDDSDDEDEDEAEEEDADEETDDAEEKEESDDEDDEEEESDDEEDSGDDEEDAEDEEESDDDEEEDDDK